MSPTVATATLIADLQNALREVDAARVAFESDPNAITFSFLRVELAVTYIAGERLAEVYAIASPPPVPTAAASAPPAPEFHAGECAACGLNAALDSDNRCAACIAPARKPYRAPAVTSIPRGEEIRIARWESISGKHWVDLRVDARGIYSYAAPSAGGVLGTKRDDAIAAITRRVEAGEFQPDSNRNPMRRVYAISSIVSDS